MSLELSSPKISFSLLFDFVKTGKVKGFSIEGYFADKATLKASVIDKDSEAKLKAIKELLKS